MGAVYLVHHVHTDERLAMKVLHPQVLRDAEAVARFRREARAPAKIASEHVARVTDADTAADLEDAPFYVMEYLRGEDLDRVLSTKGPIEPPLVVEYLAQAARALDKAHAIGVVHRDLKPENLFLTHREDGSPCIKLLDFGIARLGDTDSPHKVQTAAGFIFGTPSFMSPEQTTGAVELIGPATDIWALGLVAYKLLTGKDFWGAPNLQALYAMILTGPIPTPTEKGATLGPAFDAWFARCVARDVADRWKAAGEAIAALADALGVRLEPRARFSSAELRAAPLAGSRPDLGSASFRIPPGTVAAPDAPAGASTQSTQAPVGDDVTAASPQRSRTTMIAAVVGGGLALLLVGAVFFFVDRSTRGGEPARIVGAPSASTSPRGSVSAAVAPPPEPGASAPASPETLAAPEPGASVTGTPTPVVDAPKGHAAATAHAGAPATATTAKVATKEAPPSGEHALSREQRRRLDALQRLCDQGTFNAVECKAKRAGILRGEN